MVDSGGRILIGGCVSIILIVVVSGRSVQGAGTSLKINDLIDL
jgi:hypothetical protein